MSLHNLDIYREAFNGVGWFIPPYVSMGFLSRIVAKIRSNNGTMSQDDLEELLAVIYSAENLAAMVTERFHKVPFVCDYKTIISEAITAHFMRLDHIAVAGLLPCIEGIGRKLTDSRSVPVTSINSVFVNLAEDCKAQVTTHNIGAVGEIISMMDSFIDFTTNHLYVNSTRYPFADNTNRHGILHGAFGDVEYGKPINFYKAIASIEFLCFVAGLNHPVGIFAPDQTPASKLLAGYYTGCLLTSLHRPLSL
ncbi:MAG: hypothetical protein HIU91_14405 [Acidobacteria bacterium]|nr:hypothetical protein [Acidobacteriota bacterium]